MTWQKPGNFSLLGALSDRLTLAFRRTRTSLYQPSLGTMVQLPLARPTGPAHRRAKIIPFPSPTAIAGSTHPPLPFLPRNPRAAPKVPNLAAIPSPHLGLR
jgi:hypothetical protein